MLIIDLITIRSFFYKVLARFVFKFLQIILLPTLKEVRGQPTKYYLRNDYGLDWQHSYKFTGFQVLVTLIVTRNIRWGVRVVSQINSGIRFNSDISSIELPIIISWTFPSYIMKHRLNIKLKFNHVKGRRPRPYIIMMDRLSTTSDNLPTIIFYRSWTLKYKLVWFTLYQCTSSQNFI